MAARARSEPGRRRAWRALAENDHRDHTLRAFRADYVATVQSRLGRRATIQPAPT